ncbi:MAG: glycosyltransferase family 4 protein [Paracoccaceae bacterium]
MRICFLSRRYWPAVSGMSVYAENFVRQLARKGHEVVMLSQYRADPAGMRVYGGGPPPAMAGVRIRGLRSHGEERAETGHQADFEGDIDRMVAAVEEEHAAAPFDIIHAQYAYPTGYAGLIAAQRLGLPCVVSIQGGDGHWVGLCCRTHAEAMREVLMGAGRLLIGSASFAAEVSENHGVSPDRFTIVPGATDTALFRPPAERHRAEPIRLLYHGRVDRRKGLHELIEAADLLRAAGLAFRLTVSGIGPDLDAVKADVAARDLGAQVRFTGHVAYQDAGAVYRKADIFVSPTWSEGFSNTLLEAMATRLPIVSTETVGVVDCLADRRDALLVPVQDAASLAAAIERLMADQALAERLAATALEEVTTLYAWPVVADRILAAYADTPVAGRSSAVPHAHAAADPSCRFRASPHLL